MTTLLVPQHGATTADIPIVLGPCHVLQIALSNINGQLLVQICIEDDEMAPLYKLQQQT